MKKTFLLSLIFAAISWNDLCLAVPCDRSEFVSDIEIVSRGVKITNRARNENSSESRLERFYSNASPMIGYIKALVAFGYINKDLAPGENRYPDIKQENQRLRSKKYGETRDYIVENLTAFRTRINSSPNANLKAGLSILDELIPLLVPSPTEEQFREIQNKMFELNLTFSSVEVDFTLTVTRPSTADTVTPPTPADTNGAKKQQFNLLQDKIASVILFPIATRGCAFSLGLAQGGPFPALSVGPTGASPASSN